MSLPFDLRALSGSAFVNLVGALFLITQLDLPFRLGRYLREPETQQDWRSVPGPALFVVSRHDIRAGIFALNDPDRQRCARATPVDAEPVLEVPSPGTAPPFSWLSPVGENPEVCVMITRYGDVAAAFMSKETGDPALDRALVGEARRLRFVPARRGAGPIAVWRRIIISRSEGVRSILWF